MMNHVDQATPLWLTELGWGSAPPDSFGYQQGPHGSGAAALRLLEAGPEPPPGLERGAVLLVPLARSAASAKRRVQLLRQLGALQVQQHAEARLPLRSRASRPRRPRREARITADRRQGSFTNDPTPRFGLHSNEAGSTFECRVDGIAFRACSSPSSQPRPAGRPPHPRSSRRSTPPETSSQVVSRPFIVDTQRPSGDDYFRSRGAALPHPIGALRSASPRTSPTPASAAGSTAAASTTAAHRSPSPTSRRRSHTFQVKAADRAGNEGPITSRTWNVDGPADLSITAGPESGRPDERLHPALRLLLRGLGRQLPVQARRRRVRRLHVAAHDPDALGRRPQVHRQGDGYVPEHRCRLARLHRRHHRSGGDVSHPAQPNGSTTNDPTPTFRFSSTEPGSSFECRYEGDDFSACSGADSDTAASPLTDGPHRFQRPADRRRRKPGRRAPRQVRGRHRGARAQDQGPEQGRGPEERQGGRDLHAEGLRAGRPPVPDRLEALQALSRSATGRPRLRHGSSHPQGQGHRPRRQRRDAAQEVHDRQEASDGGAAAVPEALPLIRTVTESPRP